MGSLGFPEVFVLLVMVLIYIVITPLLLSIGLRIFVWFAEMCGVPEALGRFAAPLVRAFRVETAPDE